MTADGAPARALGLLALAAALFFLPQCQVDQPVGREEKYVTVRLHDSLSRFDSVEIVILAGSDTASIVGHIWDGRLATPSTLPSFRLDDGESRTLSIRVRGWDANGRLALDETISKTDGKQVVITKSLAKPSPRLASLDISPGTLVPAFTPDVHEYSMALANEQAALTITAAAEYGAANIYSGIKYFEASRIEDTITIEVGSNRHTLTVIAADTSDQYVVTAMRAAKPVDTTKPPDTIIVIPPDNRDTVFSAWRHKGQVLLNFDQVGLGSDFTIYDFPLLLRLNVNNFKFNEAWSDGRDIRFATANGKVLPFEIARWDANAKVAEIFIRVDTLSSRSYGNPILMYWDNASVTKTASPDKVFPTTQAWGGVWHLEETASGRANEYRDATGQYPGKGGGDIPARREGVVAYAQDFKTTNSSSWITIPKEFDPGASEFTMHMWVKQVNSDRGVLLEKDGPLSSDQRYELQQDALTGHLNWSWNTKSISTFIYLPRDTWQLLGIAWDGTQLHFYVDGYERQAVDWVQQGSATGTVILGARDEKGVLGFHGLIDEFWSLSRYQNPNYMRLIYENQKAWSSFANLSRL